MNKLTISAVVIPSALLSEAVDDLRASFERPGPARRGGEAAGAA